MRKDRFHLMDLSEVYAAAATAILFAALEAQTCWPVLAMLLHVECVEHGVHRGSVILAVHSDLVRDVAFAAAFPDAQREALLYPRNGTPLCALCVAVYYDGTDNLFENREVRLNGHNGEAAVWWSREGIQLTEASIGRCWRQGVKILPPFLYALPKIIKSWSAKPA